MNRPTESAGVLLTYQGMALLGLDTDGRVQYPGGKTEGHELPAQTAKYEMLEEFGRAVVNDDWIGRATSTCIPNQAKDIWLYHLELTSVEYDRLVHAARLLNEEPWPRDFSRITGRAEPAKQTFVRILAVPMGMINAYITLFKSVAPNRNAKDFFAFAKQFCNDHVLIGRDITTYDQIVETHMRPFNLATLSY